MSFLAKLSLANRGLVALVALVILGFGVIAIPSLKQQLLPSLSFPAAAVITAYPGVSPDIVEAQVTKPIEDSLQGVNGLDTITSTSREGYSTVTVQFAFGTNIDDVTSKMQQAINRISTQLPSTVTPQVLAGSTDDLPAIVLAASKTGDQKAFADQLTSVVVPALQGIDGVRDVQVTGTQTQDVAITLEPAAAARAGVTAASISGALRSNGVSVPAGTLTTGGQSLAVQVGGPITDLDGLKGLYVAPNTKLSDVATVELTTVPSTSYTRTDGKESLGIQVTAKPDGNAVAISDAIKDKLAGLQTQLGGDTKLTPIFDQAPFVKESISGLTTEGALGLLFAIIVILIFLLSVRSTLVTAVSIPLSIIVALIGLWVGDYSLNLLTLGALTIAVGRVVDDSIVVLENIKRHLGYGEERREAVLNGVKEVTGAVTASTLTTVAVFLPIAVVSGLVGELFGPFAITVTVALGASLLVALTIVPVLAYWFLRPPKTGDADIETVRQQALEKELRSPLQRAYVPVIKFATRRRFTTLALALLVFVVTMGLASQLKTNFINGSGQKSFTISQDLPVGASLATTDGAAKKIEDVLAKEPGVKDYQVTVGSSGGFAFGGGQGGNTATFSVAATDKADVEKMQDNLRTEIAALGDGVGTVKVGGNGGGFSNDQLEVDVQAGNADDLAKAAALVQQAMTGTPDISDVESNLTASAPRVDVAVKRDAAAKYGLSDQAVGQFVAAAYNGQTLTKLTVDGTQHDVVLHFGAPPASLDALKKLPLSTTAGPITLDQVADVKQVAGPVQITDVDGKRSAAVTGRAVGTNVGAVTSDLTKRLKALSLPSGATYSLGGVSSDQSDAFKQLGLALLAAIAIVFMIMVATFRSIAQSLILLVSIPFAATGAIALLLITNTPLGLPALIGVLMLVGIVVTNAIVLMDLINHYRQQGMGVQEAVIEGGRHRLRPILMTAIATVFALLPMALGLTGEGGFISQPLAIVVIGGLVSSTLLTLVLVPTLYTMVENRKEKSQTKRAARRARKAGVEPPKHAAEPDDETVADDEPVPVSSGGAHEAAESAPPNASPSAALRGYTDQFEVLKVTRRPEPNT